MKNSIETIDPKEKTPSFWETVFGSGDKNGFFLVLLPVQFLAFLLSLLFKKIKKLVLSSRA